jgi:hypothetical protein
MHGLNVLRPSLRLIAPVLGLLSVSWGSACGEDPVHEAITSPSHTSCFAQFRSVKPAEQAASDARSAGFHVEVEQGGAKARRPTSAGSRQIAVLFQTEQLGAEAEPLISRFREIVKNRRGGFGHPGTGCTEVSLGD